MADDLFELTSDGSLVLRLHVQPGAGRSTVVGRHGDALKIRVAAPPQQGRANAACLLLVASTFGVDAASVELVGGPASRSKRVRIQGVEPDEARRLLAGFVPVRPDTQSAGNAGLGRGVR